MKRGDYMPFENALLLFDRETNGKYRQYYTGLRNVCYHADQMYISRFGNMTGENNKEFRAWIGFFKTMLYEQNIERDIVRKLEDACKTAYSMHF